MAWLLDWSTAEHCGVGAGDMDGVPMNDDKVIIRVMKSILDNSDFVVETINEAVLVKLMDLRGTPLSYRKTLRDIDLDYLRWIEDNPDE